MDESTAEQWGVIVQETFAHQRPRGRVGPRHAAQPRRHHRRLRGRPAHALAADRDPGRAGRRRRRAGRRRAVPRHRQGDQRAQPPAHRGRDPAALRARRGALDDPGAPGLPGPPLLRAPRRRPERARPAPAATSRTRSPSASPTSGTSTRSTPTTTRCRSSTSRSASARCSARPSPSDRSRASVAPGGVGVPRPAVRRRRVDPPSGSRRRPHARRRSRLGREYEPHGYVGDDFEGIYDGLGGRRLRRRDLGRHDHRRARARAPGSACRTSGRDRAWSSNARAHAGDHVDARPARRDRRGAARQHVGTGGRAAARRRTACGRCVGTTTTASSPRSTISTPGGSRRS